MIIRVPGTTANVGPGFDCFGIAFNIYNEFEFKIGEISDEDSLMLKAFNYYFETVGVSAPTVKINVIANIPQSRGLGSSATCIVAGLYAANEYNDNKLNKYDLLKLATDLEGHPDNVAAAIFGGHTIAFEDKVLKIEVSDDLQFYALIPDFKISTEESRNLVQKEISVKNAVQNIAGAAFITHALRLGDFDLLKKAPDDSIHEYKRMQNLENIQDIKKIFNEDNSKIFLSGSGSTLLLVSKKEIDFSNEFEKLNSLSSKWDIATLKVDNFGAQIYEL